MVKKWHDDDDGDDDTDGDGENDYYQWGINAMMMIIISGEQKA